MKAMHIVMMTDYYLPTLGGVQTSIKAQKEALEALGHRVTILCPLHEPSQDFSIIQLPTHPRLKPDGYPLAWPPKDLYAKTLSLLRQLDPDVVHVHSEMFAALAGIKAAHTLGLPLVQTMHGRLDVYARQVFPAPALTTTFYERIHHRYISHTTTTITPGYPYTATRTARNMWRNMVAQANAAHQVIVPSAHFAQKLRTQGVHRPISVISNGLEDSVLTALSDAHVRTRQPHQPLRILWCGRVSPEKRPLIFLDAISRIQHPVQVDMYGDGVAMNKVKKYIARHSLENRVTVHGGVPQADIFAAMRASHIFVSSSYDFDNQPMVMLEATSTGLPVIYCDPDLGEVVPPTGSICTPNPSAEALAQTLDNLASTPERIEALSKEALANRIRVEQTNFTDTLLSVYAAATQGPSS